MYLVLFLDEIRGNLRLSDYYSAAPLIVFRSGSEFPIRIRLDSDNDFPLGRPIVSDVNSVSRACASFVEYFLVQIPQSSPSYLRDSQHLLAILQDDFPFRPDCLFQGCQLSRFRSDSHACAMNLTPSRLRTQFSRLKLK